MIQREILNNLAPDFERENQPNYIEEKKDEIISFIKSYLISSGMDGYVLGVSGGIDSFLVGALCACACREINKELVLLMLPNKTQEDFYDSKACCEAIQLIYTKCKVHTINIQNAYEGVLNDFGNANLPLSSTYTLGNIQARLRMIYQYAYKTKYLVAGTDHSTESITGFYTKYGDGGSDINPILQLIKDDIYLMSKLFNPPKCIMIKAPSAGLGISKTDEDELNLKYSSICSYLRGNIVEESARIEHLYAVSMHKRQMPVNLNNAPPPQITHVIVDFINAFINGTMPCQNSEIAVANAIEHINGNPSEIVLYVCDNHPKGHCSFNSSGGVWMEHALVGTQDAQIHKRFFSDIRKTINTPLERYNIFYKGRDKFTEQYSGYEAQNEDYGMLQANLTKKVVVSGIATEYCIKSTVCDLLKNGYEVTILKDCLGYINKENHFKTLAYLEAQGAIVLTK